MTQRYLVCYDYGMGGLWAVIESPSGGAIIDKYPEVLIVDQRPAWLNDVEYAKLPSFTLNDGREPSWFQMLERREAKP